jgi:hypothetical protein
LKTLKFDVQFYLKQQDHWCPRVKSTFRCLNHEKTSNLDIPKNKK